MIPGLCKEYLKCNLGSYLVKEVFSYFKTRAAEWIRRTRNRNRRSDCAFPLGKTDRTWSERNAGFNFSHRNSYANAEENRVTNWGNHGMGSLQLNNQTSQTSLHDHWSTVSQFRVHFLDGIKKEIMNEWMKVDTATNNECAEERNVQE